MPTSPVRLNPEIPDELERAINKCLEKDKDLRYQHASDLRSDLKRLKRDTTSGATAAHPAAGIESRPRGVVPWALAGAGALALAGGAGWWFASGRTPETSPIKITPFTTDGGSKRTPQLSPDGERVAYSWAGVADDNRDI